MTRMTQWISNTILIIFLLERIDWERTNLKKWKVSFVHLKLSSLVDMVVENHVEHVDQEQKQYGNSDFNIFFNSIIEDVYEQKELIEAKLTGTYHLKRVISNKMWFITSWKIVVVFHKNRRNKMVITISACSLLPK